jgi:hypothetical protein
LLLFDVDGREDEGVGGGNGHWLFGIDSSFDGLTDEKLAAEVDVEDDQGAENRIGLLDCDDSLQS